MSFSVNTAKPLSPVPNLLVRMPPDDPAKIEMEKLWSNINGMSNKLAVEGDPISFRNYISAEWLIVSDVQGDRVFFQGMRAYTTNPTGFMNGGTAYSFSVDGAGVLQRSPNLTIQDWHSRPKTRFQIMENNEIATGTEWRAEILNHYKPNAPSWYALATIDVNGNQSDWAYSPVYTTPASPSNFAPSGNVSETEGNNGAPTLTDVVDTNITPPNNISIALENSGNTPVISWSIDPADYGVIIRRVDYDPQISTLDSCCDLGAGEGSNVSVGDILVVAKEFAPATTRDEYNVVRNYNQQTIESSPLEDVIGNVLPAYINEDTDKPRLQLTLDPNATATIRRRCIGAADQDFYTVLEDGKTYNLRVRARLVSGTATLTPTCSAFDFGGPIALTATMQDFDFPFVRNASSDTNSTSPFLINFDGGATGGVIEVELIAAWETTGGQDIMGLTSAADALFTPGSFGGIRDHDAAKTRPSGPDLLGLTDRYGSLFNNMFIFKDRVDSWWNQLPPWINADQAQGYVEWLRAPYDPATDTPTSKPWAYRRYAAGQQEPWTDVYDYIGVQMGNEAFNTANSSFWTTAGGINGTSNGEASALIEDLFAREMKASPYWVDDGKLGFEFGGQRGQGFGEDVLNTAQEASRVHDNAYNGSDFYENVANESLVYSSGWAHAIQQIDETRWRTTFGDKDASRKLAEAALGRSIGLGVYEGQQSTPKAPASSIPDSEKDIQQAAWWSKACQTAIIDNFTMSALNDYSLWAWYTLTGLGGNYWNGFARPQNGGATAAAMQWLSLLSQLYLPGRIFECPAAIETKQTVSEEGVSYANVPQVFGRAFYASATNKAGILLRNRRIAGEGLDELSGDGISNVLTVIPKGVANVRVYEMLGSAVTSNETDATKNDLMITNYDVAVPIDRRLSLNLSEADCKLIDFL